MLADEVAALPEPFATAVEEALACFEADDGVEALFLGGSLAMGEFAQHSDIDLVAIKTEDVNVMERYVRYVRGVQVQVIAGPPLQFDIWLERDRPQLSLIHI